MDTVEQLRDWANSIRRKPAPLSDAIPMVCNAADEIESLRQQLTAALAACEAKAEFLQFAWRDIPMSEFAFLRLEEAIAIKPDAPALKAHDEALIERVASEFVDSPRAEMFRQDIVAAIRELKAQEEIEEPK